MTVYKNDYIMAIDVGVSNVKTGLVDSQGQIRHYAYRSTPIERGAGSVAPILVDTCREVLNQAQMTAQNPVAIGCSVPGYINTETGIIVSSATPSWIGVNISEPLENSFDRPVAIEGDGNALAHACYTFGPTKNHDPLLAINIGTGISSGYIVNKTLLRGYGQAAMEIGHMHLHPHGRPCSCGLRGCWEAHAGGGALRTLLKEYQEAGHQLPNIPEEIAELAYANHGESIEIWNEQGFLLGRGIAILLNVLNPRTIVLGGGLLNSWSLFKKNLLKIAREKALSRNSEAAIVCAPDPERSALLGAAVIASQKQKVSDFFIDAQAQAT
jgi:glucokinase